MTREQGGWRSMASPAVAQSPTDAQARAVQPLQCGARGDVKSIQKQVLMSGCASRGARLAARPRASCLALPHDGDRHPDDQGCQDRQDLSRGELAERSEPVAGEA